MYRLSEVSRSPKAPGAPALDVNGLAYMDTTVVVGLDVKENFLRFHMENTSDGPIYLNWDRSVFIDFSGDAVPILHGDMRVTDVGRPFAPRVIPAGVRLREIMVPARAGRGIGLVPWPTDTVYGRAGGAPPPPNADYTGDMKAMVGRTLRLMLSFDTSSGQVDYTFSLEIASVLADGPFPVEE